MNELSQDHQLHKHSVMPRYFDVKGREITDGCVIWNPADKNPEQSVKLIDGELWFGAFFNVC